MRRKCKIFIRHVTKNPMILLLPFGDVPRFAVRTLQRASCDRFRSPFCCNYKLYCYYYYYYYYYYYHSYFRVKGRFPGEPGSAGSCFSTCSGREPLWLVERFFTGRVSFLPPNHQCRKHWREHKALTTTSGLASSFLHPQPGFRWKGRCCTFTPVLRLQYLEIRVEILSLFTVRFKGEKVIITSKFIKHSCS